MQGTKPDSPARHVVHPRNLGRPAVSTTSSTSPSSTGANPSSTAITPGDSRDPASGIFSPTGSPPLILAFLAVGLFAAVMIAVFGWRRMRFGRGGLIVHTAQGVGQALPRDFGKRPELWDLWTSCPAQSFSDWRNIIPFSVQTTTHVSPMAPSPPVEPLLDITRYIRLRQPCEKNDDGETKGKEIESNTQVQIAVAIAMPSARKSRKVDGEEDVLEYSIGIVQVPYAES